VAHLLENHIELFNVIVMANQPFQAGKHVGLFIFGIKIITGDVTLLRKKISLPDVANFMK